MDMNTIEREKDIIKKMVVLYCRKKHLAREGLCSECRELLGYAYSRLDLCKFGQQKPTCQRCTVHCYKPLMRQRVKVVMRFAGPRMLFVHPVDAVRHILKNKARNL